MSGSTNCTKKQVQMLYKCLTECAFLTKL